MDTEKKIDDTYTATDAANVSVVDVPLDATTKTRWERSWPTIACGAGLFSDGYVNGVRSSSA